MTRRNYCVFLEHFAAHLKELRGLPVEKRWFKAIGHSLKKLDPSQKTLRHSWCPKLVTGVLSTDFRLVLFKSLKYYKSGLIILTRK